MAFTGVAGAIATQVGSVALPAAFNSQLQQNPANTTTAVNMLIVINGVAQGLIQSMRINESFNPRGVDAISSAVAVANIPGVYKGSGSINRAFIFGQTFEQALGGNIRPVVGKSPATPDFTQLYFNIVEVDNQGNALHVRHDCLLSSISRTYEINNVLIIEDADFMIRWTS